MRYSFPTVPRQNNHRLHRHNSPPTNETPSTRRYHSQAENSRLEFNKDANPQKKLLPSEKRPRMLAINVRAGGNNKLRLCRSSNKRVRIFSLPMPPTVFEFFKCRNYIKYSTAWRRCRLFTRAQRTL